MIDSYKCTSAVQPDPSYCDCPSLCSPSDFTNDMSTLEPLETIVHDDVADVVVVAFGEEQLGGVATMSAVSHVAGRSTIR